MRLFQGQDVSYQLLFSLQYYSDFHMNKYNRPGCFGVVDLTVRLCLC